MYLGMSYMPPLAELAFAMSACTSSASVLMHPERLRGSGCARNLALHLQRRCEVMSGIGGLLIPLSAHLRPVKFPVKFSVCVNMSFGLWFAPQSLSQRRSLGSVLHRKGCSLGVLMV